MNKRTLPFELKPSGGPFDDPALLVTPSNSDLSILFDCGTLHGLKTRDLQRVRWLFLSHLHIDHLIGFDHLLRTRLFSPLPLTVYGPAGTVDVIEHRLQGYAWNLTSGSPFIVRALELPSSVSPNAEFHCHDRFQRVELSSSSGQESPTKDGTVRLSEQISVKCHQVQHGVPCLGFRLDRQTPRKFSLETARCLGLEPGPWVGRLIAGEPMIKTVEGKDRDEHWLEEKLLRPGDHHSVGYLTDTLLDIKLLTVLAEFFGNVDVLCSEVAYLKSEVDLATQNLHMTTEQVARLATVSGAKELRLFHLSRRHCETGSEPHLVEVQDGFPTARLLSEPAISAGPDQSGSLSG